MPVINRSPINANNDNEHYEVFVERQERADKNYDTARSCSSIPVGSTVLVQ